MSMDAVALLRITQLPPIRTEFGTTYSAEHRDDASLVNLHIRWEGTVPDELALSLRELLGDALDTHDDPRGILFFADIWEPAGATYDEIVARIGKDGVWAEKVGADHIPLRYRTAAPDSRDGIVGRLIGTLGRDPALELAFAVEIAAYGHAARPDDEAAAARLAETLAPIAAALGDAAAATLRTRFAEMAIEAQRALQRPPIILEE